MRAYCAIRKGPLYRSEAFHAGLRAVGFEVREGYPGDGADLLVIWNRYGEGHGHACAAEKRGIRVLVAENGYLGRGGSSPKFDAMGEADEEHQFALAIGGHNGQGKWPDGGPERFARLGVELRPLRDGGDHILVCANRAFGFPGRIMPMDWPLRVVERLRGQTKLPIVSRGHPGNDRPKVPLEKDLTGTWAVVTWYSSAGVHALVAGVPVVAEAPTWVCMPAAQKSLEEVGRLDPAAWDAARRRALERMAWAQWSMAEVRSGEAFKRLLEL